MGENTLQVDPDELAAEAERVELPPEMPGAPAAGDAIPPSPEPADGAPWSTITPGVVEGVDLFVCPAWELSSAEKTALADALAPALEQLFPGGIGDERWAPYFRVLIVAGGIVATRYDRATGKLKPLRAKAPRADAAAAAGDDAARGPFTIGGAGRH